MPEHRESLGERLAAAREGFELLLVARQASAFAEGCSASTAPGAGFRHWGDTPQWYDWCKGPSA